MSTVIEQAPTAAPSTARWVGSTVAAITAVHDGLRADGGWWLRADPVCLRADLHGVRDRAVLAGRQRPRRRDLQSPDAVADREPLAPVLTGRRALRPVRVRVQRQRRTVGLVGEPQRQIAARQRRARASARRASWVATAMAARRSPSMRASRARSRCRG